MNKSKMTELGKRQEELLEQRERLRRELEDLGFSARSAYEEAVSEMCALIETTFGTQAKKAALDVALRFKPDLYEDS